LTIIVDAAVGRLRGRRDPVSGVSRFFGIPYAPPPIEELRWRAPGPAPQWSGVRDAQRAAPRCLQHAPYGELEPDNPNQSEDCLYLNVWAPDRSVNAKLPVIFWIHGGEFWAGSGSEPRYNGKNLTRHGAVVVTINHRLGVFGFLSHPELRAESGQSGNFGLLDQIAALKWVRANIAAFGGDPHCITVAGESAGSCSVSALMASPLSTGLFQRALGQSCAYFMPEPHAMRPLSLAENEQRGIEFMHKAGANSLAQLKSRSARFVLDSWLLDTSKRFQPCVDDHVLPRVDDVFALGQQSPIPLLTGWNKEEMGYMRASGGKFDAKAFRQSVERSFGDRAGSLLSAYESENALESAVALTSDRTMTYPTWKWAGRHSARAPVFVYQFDRCPPESPFGAAHACEIEYVFGTLDSKPRPYEQADRILSERIADYWVNFARTGDPNGAGLEVWPAYGSDKSVLRLDSEIASRPLDRRARLELLDSLYREGGKTS
jgi:para-nitrobenzyl esterase